MPGFKGHLVGGAALYGALIYAGYNWLQPSPIVAAEWLVFMLAGSLFPDMDVKSKGQNLFYAIIFVVFSMLLLHGCYKMVAFLSILALIPMLVRHRGLFHAWWFVIAFPCVLGLILSYCMPEYTRAIMFDAGFFALGALSHLALDRGLGMFK